MTWKFIKQKFHIDYFWSVFCVYVIYNIFGNGLWRIIDYCAFAMMLFGIYIYLIRPLGKGIMEILFALKIRNEFFDLLSEKLGVELKTIKLLSKKLIFDYTIGHYNMFEIRKDNDLLFRFDVSIINIQTALNFFIKANGDFFKTELENLMIEDLAGLK